MNEQLTKTSHDLGFAISDLQDALKQANAVEGLIVLPLIKKAVELRRDAEDLLAARCVDGVKS